MHHRPAIWVDNSLETYATEVNELRSGVVFACGVQDVAWGTPTRGYVLC
jgi:hypothetical protein